MPTRSTRQTSPSTRSRTSASTAVAPARPKKKAGDGPLPPRRRGSPGAEPTPGATSPVKLNGISSDAVARATGKGWDEWLSILDGQGASALPHAGIVQLLHETPGVGEWWSQMITVGYEQARGLRLKHQKPDGFQISVSKTINASVAHAFAACDSTARRRRWLPDQDLVIRRSTPLKSIRALLAGTKMALVISFTEKGQARCAVVIEHSRITSASAAARLKSMWAARLLTLQTLLED